MAGEALDPIRAAMQQFMTRSRPNSGTRPPNLTVSANSHRTCSSCVNFREGRCRLYSYKTRPDEVCDSWEPRPH